MHGNHGVNELHRKIFRLPPSSVACCFYCHIKNVPYFAAMYTIKMKFNFLYMNMIELRTKD